MLLCVYRSIQRPGKSVTSDLALASKLTTVALPEGILKAVRFTISGPRSINKRLPCKLFGLFYANLHFRM